MTNSVLAKSLIEISQDLASGSITSQEITARCLKKIKTYDEELGSMLWVDEEYAQSQALASDKRRSLGQARGRLDGIPLAIKDMILVRELKATAASKILEGFYPPYDAFVIEKLKEQGAVLIGKANQDEFAMGSSNESSAFKICKNPWDLTRTPGGSSGGSAAALSAGMCFGSLGTDTGGSIRQPASYCGLVGIKPTYGRVSRFGVVAFASSLDQVGPFARSVRDAGLLLSAIAGYDKRDATCSDLPVPDYASLINSDITGKRIGVPKEYFAEGLSEEVREAVVKTLDILKSKGAILVDISLPHTKYAVSTYYIIATAEASSNLCRYDGIRFGPRRSDGKDLLSLYEDTRGELFGPEVKRRIMLGTYVLSAGYYDAYYVRAQKVRRLFAEDFKKAFQHVDAIISPTAPTTAFKIGEKIDDPLAMYLNDIYTISANLAGNCAISLPIGCDKSGMPIGVQLMANAFLEQNLFDIASCIEQEIQFKSRSSLFMSEG